MPSLQESLRLIIQADTAGAVREIENVGHAADRALPRTEDHISRVGIGFTRAGVAMTAAGAVMAAGLYDAAQSASDLGEAVNASQVVFGDAIGIIDEYAKTSAESMGLSERAYRQALVPIGAMLQNVGFEQEEAAETSVKLAQRAADMASVFNVDVATALEAIQAGLRGEADPLERFGVGLNEAAVNAKAVELGLAGSTAEVDASAKAQARLALIFEQTNGLAGDFANTSDSLANRQRILAARFEDLKAAIGAGVIPVLETLFGVAEGGIGAFTSLDESMGGTLGQVATFATVGLIAGGGISLLIGQIIKMRESLVAAQAFISSTTTKLGGLGNAAKLAGAVAGIGALILAAKELGDAANQINVDKLAAALNSTSEASRASTEEVIRVSAAFNRLDSDFAKVLDTSVPAAEQFIAIAEAIGVEEEAIDRLRAALAAKIAEDVGGADAAAGYSTEVQNQTDATREATSALQEYNDALRASTDPIFSAMSAISGNRDAQLGYQDALNGVVAAQAALDEAIAAHGPTSQEAADATRGLEDAQRALDDAQWQTVTSAAEVDAALADLKDAVDRGDVSVDQFKATLGVWVAQGYLTQAQADAAAAAIGGLAAQADVADQKRVEIDVSTPGALGAISALDAVTSKVNQVPRNVTVAIGFQVYGQAELNRARALTGRQHGGPVMAGEAYIVGESGPELLVPDRPGWVIPNDEYGHVVPAGSWGGGMAGGGMGGGTTVNYNITVAGSVWSERELVSVINRQMDQGARIGRHGRRL